MGGKPNLCRDVLLKEGMWQEQLTQNAGTPGAPERGSFCYPFEGQIPTNAHALSYFEPWQPNGWNYMHPVLNQFSVMKFYVLGNTTPVYIAV